MEAYFYFNLPEGNAICHLMGEPQEERLVWLHNEQAITSPEWSIHAAAGTSNYTFIWGMAGENLKYSDKDEIKYTEMKIKLPRKRGILRTGNASGLLGI